MNKKRSESKCCSLDFISQLDISTESSERITELVIRTIIIIPLFPFLYLLSSSHFPLIQMGVK